MTTHDDIVTRRYVAAILGLLGVMVLLDVAMIAVLQPDAQYDGFRQVLFVIIGGLLVCGGAVTFKWPHRGGVETTDEGDDEEEPPATVL